MKKQNIIYRQKTKLFIPGAILMLTLNSCNIYKKYEAPVIDSEKLYGEERLTGTITIATIPWRGYFTDTLLINLINEGINSNYDMQIAYTSIFQAEASLKRTKAAYFPEISLSGDANHTRTSGTNILSTESTNFSLGISASWEIDLWGKLLGQSRSQAALLLNTYEYRNLYRVHLFPI